MLLCLLGLWCFLGLAGCVQGKCEATVNWDGSARLEYALNLDFALPDSFPREQLDDFAASHGYQSSVKSESSSSQITLSKDLASFEELPAAIQETIDMTAGLTEGSLQNNDTIDKQPDSSKPPVETSPGQLPDSLPQNLPDDVEKALPKLETPSNLPSISAPAGLHPRLVPLASFTLASSSARVNPIVKEEGIFMDSYHVSTNVDLSNIDPYASKEDLLAMGMSFLFDVVTSDADLRFVLHLPLAAQSSNATSVSEDGKTLEWKLVMGQNNLISFDMEAPNLTNIALTAGLLLALVLVSLALYWFLLRKA